MERTILSRACLTSEYCRRLKTFISGTVVGCTFADGLATRRLWGWQWFLAVGMRLALCFAAERGRGRSLNVVVGVLEVLLDLNGDSVVPVPEAGA